MAEIVEFSIKARQRPPPKPSGRRFDADNGNVLFLPCVRREPIDGESVGQAAPDAGGKKRIS